MENVSKSIPKIELGLQVQYDRICKILNSRSPLSVITQVAGENNNFKNKINELRKKQENCISKHIRNLEEIAENLGIIANLCADGNQNSLQCSELELKQEIQSLNRKCLEQSLENDLYNPKTFEALSIIKNELLRTLEEQSDLKAILSSRLSRYESDPSLQKILHEYIDVQSKIQAKKRDLDTLNS